MKKATTLRLLIDRFLAAYDLHRQQLRSFGMVKRRKKKKPVKKTAKKGAGK